ncbi:hypothetical protein BGX34_004953 [Mortierella sp. NVP85]|nr:hypothetical protein BGX34_004953 [Mortierella sp. NVP85]
MSSNLQASQDLSATFHGWAATGNGTLEPFDYHPRPLGPKDVEVEISHCGICGSDVHIVNGEWGPPPHGPCVPGHEVVGKVAAIGSNSHHKIGDLVAIGAQVQACGNCQYCNSDRANFCPQRTFTINDVYKDSLGGNSYGGFADRVRVNSDFAFKVPSELSAAEAAPLMCAGITTYAPLKRYGAGPDKTVGVVGIGGLGHLGIQWAHAMGAKEVVAISSSDRKREESVKLGATKYVNSKNPEDLKAASQSIDILLCTSFASETDWSQLLDLVATCGVLVILGVSSSNLNLPSSAILGRQLAIAGSMVGGRLLTQDMLEFAAKNNVRPWIKKMPMSDPNAAVKSVMNDSPRYRIVLEKEAPSQQ